MTEKTTVQFQISFLSKLLERVIAARFFSHLSSHNLMSKL